MIACGAKCSQVHVKAENRTQIAADQPQIAADQDKICENPPYLRDLRTVKRTLSQP
jgi:hypothetical protein